MINDLTIKDIYWYVVVLLWIISAVVSWFFLGDTICMYVNIGWTIVALLSTVLEMTSLNFNLWLNKKLWQ